MTKREKINQVLAEMALSTIEIDDTDKLGSMGPTLSEAIPRSLAQQVCARLRYLGIETDWAPDADEPDTVWIYLEQTAADLDDELA